MKKNVFAAFFLLGTQIANARNADTLFIKRLLESRPDLFSVVLNHPACKEVQVLYTQIDRDKNNQPHFTVYSYRLDDTHYFYPASTVKLPAAIFALEKINALQIPGLCRLSSMQIDSVRKEQKPVTEDQSATNGQASVGNYIKKILLVSDNDAFNRLFEFIGRGEINQKIQHYGLTNTRILNRLAIRDGGENARHTNPVSFYNNGKLVYKQPAQYDPKDYPLTLTNTIMGKAYLDSNDQRVNNPFDFSNRNAYALTDQQELMKRLIFPEAFSPKRRFLLTTEDYDFLYQYMSKYPTESFDPKYDTGEYFPAYGKFLFYGQERYAPINSNIRIFNKIGDSYGFLIDNMYFVDYKNKVEFFLAAVVQSNDDEIYNNDHYEYRSVCYPFMKNLGQIIYQCELQRKKKRLPDLKKFERYK
ncbi:MAG: serine hydrolase [Chitinophagaceae bacterium]